MLPSWLTAAADWSGFLKICGDAITTVAVKSGLLAPLTTTRMRAAGWLATTNGTTALICQSDTYSSGAARSLKNTCTPPRDFGTAPEPAGVYVTGAAGPMCGPYKDTTSPAATRPSNAPHAALAAPNR